MEYEEEEVVGKNLFDTFLPEIFKDDVKEVGEGFECGIGIGYDKVKEGDIIDAFSEETITRRLK